MFHSPGVSLDPTAVMFHSPGVIIEPITVTFHSPGVSIEPTAVKGLPKASAPNITIGYSGTLGDKMATQLGVWPPMRDVNAAPNLREQPSSSLKL